MDEIETLRARNIAMGQLVEELLNANINSRITVIGLQNAVDILQKQLLEAMQAKTEVAVSK